MRCILLRYIVACVPLVIYLSTAMSGGLDEYVSRFDRMDRRINNGQGYCGSLNTAGELAWGESYILQAYIEMYRATGDRAYLDDLVDHFDRVLSNRDDVRKTRDFYRNTSLAGWGSN